MSKGFRPPVTALIALVAAMVSFGAAITFTDGVKADVSRDEIVPPVRYTFEGPVPGSWFTSATADNKCWKVKASESGFAKKMNAARTANGKGKLSLDPEISKVARKHTKEMINQALLHHTSSDALRNRVTRWQLLGENVGVGATVDSLHVAFMNSPAHRENILLSSFKHVGVGVIKDGGRMWVTVIFENTEDPGTTLKMPRC